MDITRVIEQTCACCGEDYLVYKESDLHPNYNPNVSVIGWHCNNCWNKIKGE